MFEDYLYKLVQTHNRVIVPQLGAFLKKDRTDTAEGTLVFSPFLRFNDGLIENFLVNTEKFSKEDAVKTVQDFVKKVKEAVGKQETVEVKKMGAFYLDARGAIQFSFSGDAKKLHTKVEKTADQQSEVVPTTVDPLVEIPEVEVASTDNFDKKENTSLPIPEVSDAKGKKKGKRTVKTVAATTAPLAVDTDMPTKIESSSTDTSATAEEEKTAGTNKIDAAAIQLEKWQQKVSEEHKTYETEKPQATPVETIDTTKVEISATDTSESNIDNTRERALKIQHDKMMTLERMKTQFKKSDVLIEEKGEEYNAPVDVLLNDDNMPASRPLRRRKPVGWLVALIVVAGGLIAAVLLWDVDDVKKAFNDAYKSGLNLFESKPQKTKTAASATVSVPPIRDTSSFVAQASLPTIKKIQKGMFYLAVYKDNNIDTAKEFCTILLRLGYSKAEIILTSKNAYVVCIDKGKSKEALAASQQTTPYKYGQTWILE
jgi:hypothetical protein